MREPPSLDLTELLTTLREAGVEFIVVGGVAVIAHGFERATRDLDIVPAPDSENLRRLEQVLESLDYWILGMEEFDPDEVVQPDLEALEAGGSWVLATRLGRLDILQAIEPGFDYARLAEASFESEVDGTPVRFCGYDDLLAMKRAAGRSLDLADIERLRAIRREERD